MIEISLGKLVLLALIALIVLGPEKLPGAARTAGAVLRRLRSGWDNVRAEVEHTLEVEEIKRTAREAASQAGSSQGQLKSMLNQVQGPFVEIAEMVNPAVSRMTKIAAAQDNSAVSTRSLHMRSDLLPDDPPAGPPPMMESPYGSA
jgi:sec-independent protein translocase protein TatB